MGAATKEHLENYCKYLFSHVDDFMNKNKCFISGENVLRATIYATHSL